MSSSEAVAKAASLLQNLCRALNENNVTDCSKSLAELKKIVVTFPSFLNPQSAQQVLDGTLSEQPTTAEVALVRDYLERAVLFCARQRDLESFERYYHQLQVYYNDFPPNFAAGCSNMEPIRIDEGADPSVASGARSGTAAPQAGGGASRSSPPETAKIRLLLTGLNLMRLLVSNRVAEFHSALEQLGLFEARAADGTPIDVQNHVYIRFPIQLNRAMMDGSYKKLQSSRRLAPSNEFSPILDLLEEAVRRDMMASIPKSYDTLPVEAVKRMLLTSPSKESRETGVENEGIGTEKWKRSGEDARYIFEENALVKKEVLFHDLLAHSMTLAIEMEKVV